MSNGDFSHSGDIRNIASAASFNHDTTDAPKPLGPIVTPDPVPSDENLVKLLSAASAGAIVGSLVAYRWLSRRFVVRFRNDS